MKRFSILLSVLLITLFIFSACDDARFFSETNDLSNAQFIHEAAGVDVASANFALDMLKLNLKDEKNVMISPLSVLIALGMTANGAKGETLTEMEKVLFGGDSIEEYNAYYHTLFERITNPSKGKITIANSL